MENDRRKCAREILEAVDHGRLPVEEFENRLEKIIGRELSGPIRSEYSGAKVELCNSLLWQLRTGGTASYESSLSRLPEMIAKKYEKAKKRRILLRIASAAAAALVVFCMMTVKSLSRTQRWFTGESSRTGDQFIITGHEIDSAAAAAALASCGETAYFDSESLEELEAFLGMETGFPQRLGRNFTPEVYYAVKSNIFLITQCRYTDGGSRTISLDIHVFGDMNSARLSFEQIPGSRSVLTLSGKTVNAFTNLETVNYVWTSGNTVYSLTCHDSDKYAVDGELVAGSLEVIEELMENWYGSGR